MVEITLQFKTAEEAIVALAKMSGGAAAKAAAGEVNPSAVNPVTPATAAASRGRKPRADAGQPRGPNARTQSGAVAVPGTTADEAGSAPAGTTDASKAAERAANSMSTTPAQTVPGAAAHAPEPAAPAPVEVDKTQPPGVAPGTAGPVEIPKIEEAEAALTKLFETKGLAIAQSTLGAFGVKRLKELLPEDRAKFIADAKAAL